MTRLKRCPRCRRWKPRASAFDSNSARRDGRSVYCRACRVKKERETRATRRANGRCDCGRRPLAGYRTCLRCLDKARQRTGSQPWQRGRRGRPPEGPSRIGRLDAENGPGALVMAGA